MSIQKIEAHSPEAQSVDLIADNIAKLKAMFPELLTETTQGGKTTASLNVEVLKNLVGDATAADSEEKYGLNWHGKRKARQIALTPSTGTLRPAPDESVDWDTTQNLMIEGDNLEVLKLLQKSYAGKVKLIYIDPPYNTGKDFVYPDNFQDNIKNYLELTGQTHGGAKISSNTEASGRFHTDWLNMMLPRLMLAKNLLSPDGIFLASIDDVEVHHLRLLLDMVFGPENFEGCMIWEGGRKNDSRRISSGHDYILVYAKSSSKLQELDVRWRERKAGLDEVYAKAQELREIHREDWASGSKALQTWFKNLPEGSPAKEHSHYKMLDSEGVWYGDNMSSPNPRPNLTFEWKGFEPPSNGWRYDRAAMEKLDAQGLLIYPSSKDQRIQFKRYLHQTETTSPASVFYKDRRAASKYVSSLMDSDVFDFPKDPDVLARLIGTITEPGDIVMDFFAGSGSTGHAVWNLDLQNLGARSFILVQLPEPVNPSNKEQVTAADFCDSIKKPRNIAELTKERLRRTGQRLRQENPDWKGDAGFRSFKLDSSNIRAWSPNRSDISASLLQALEHIEDGRSNDDLLYEILIKLGLSLCVPIEVREIGGKSVHSIGGGALMACLDERISLADAEALALGMAQWREQQGTATETTAVFRDSAFENDVAKSNLAAILEQHGVKQVRSL